MQQQNLSPWWKMIFNYIQLKPLPLRVGKKNHIQNVVCITWKTPLLVDCWAYSAIPTLFSFTQLLQAQPCSVPDFLFEPGNEIHDSLVLLREVINLLFGDVLILVQVSLVTLVPKTLFPLGQTLARPGNFSCWLESYFKLSLVQVLTSL